MSANEAGTIYYTLDGTEPTTSSSVYGTPIPVTSSLTLKYFAKDLAGNAETAKSQVYTLAFPLTVTRSGMGSGTVTADTGVLSWTGATGTATYDRVTAVTLTASPAGGSGFGGWSGDCTGTSLTCAVTMDRIRNVGAGFTDITAPTGTVTYAGGAYATGSAVTLSLSASDATGISAMRYSGVDGGPWTELSYAEALSWNLGTTEGPKTIYVQFKDNAGNWSQSYGYTLMLDMTAPVLSVTGPGDESYTNQAVVLVTGTAADGLSGLKSLTVNGTPVVVQSGSFSYALTLSDGANVIRTVATDNAGNAITDTRTVTLDTIAPETLANPSGGTYGTVRSVTLTANETATIYYTLDGTEPTTSSSVYGTPIPVTSSLTLKYFAKDLAGNAETIKSQVYTLTFPLTVTRSGMGSGTVTADTGVLSWTGATGTATYDRGDGSDADGISGCGIRLWGLERRLYGDVIDLRGDDGPYTERGGGFYGHNGADGHGNVCRGRVCNGFSGDVVAFGIGCDGDQRHAVQWGRRGSLDGVVVCRDAELESWDNGRPEDDLCSVQG